MKKIIFLSVLLLLSSPINAKVFKFKAFSTAVFFTDGHEPIKNEDVNILVVLDMDKLKLNIYAEKEGNIDIIEVQSAFVDNDNIDHFKFKGVDNDGYKCDVELLLFINRTTDQLGSLVVVFNNGTKCCYRLKSNE